MKKAVDTVEHDILIEKLDHYGVRGVAKDWFITYLKGRRQFVVAENEPSSAQEILTGVRQGSVILQSNKSLEVLAKQMNKYLLNLSHWLRANKMSLNI